MSNPSGYADFVRVMCTQLNLWKATNPQANVTIVWHFPPDVGLIGAMCDAVDLGYASANADAKRMLNELGWDIKARWSPTIWQVKSAIDTIYGSPDPEE